MYYDCESTLAAGERDVVMLKTLGSRGEMTGDAMLVPRFSHDRAKTLHGMWMWLFRISDPSAFKVVRTVNSQLIYGLIDFGSQR